MHIGKSIRDIQVSSAPYYPINDTKPPQNVDELWIDLGDYKISIYNRIEFSDTPKGLNSLIGQVVTEIAESDNSITFTTTGASLKIDLREEAYFGPEALVLYGPSNLCIVWN